MKKIASRTIFSLTIAILLSLGFAFIRSDQAEATGGLNITFPKREVTAAPGVATRKIIDQKDGEPEGVGNIDIPYIQTETSLTPTASADPGDVPAGGGIKFNLDDGKGHIYNQYDMSGPSPYSVTFTDLVKSEYTLTVDVVNSSQVVQEGAGLHDQATNIGIGDIITAIGDSVTAGQDYYLDAVSNWTEVDSQYLSNDSRNFQQPDHFGRSFHLGFTKRLNDDLSTSYGYPVFVMNEGSAGMVGEGYAAYINSSADWQLVLR